MEFKAGGEGCPKSSCCFSPSLCYTPGVKGRIAGASDKLHGGRDPQRPVEVPVISKSTRKNRGTKVKVVK